MRKKYSRSESTTYFRKFKVDHVRGIHHPKELSVNTAPNSAKWPPCHVKLLLVICAILLNRWWILIYYFFYGHVKLWRFLHFWLYGGRCDYIYTYAAQWIFNSIISRNVVIGRKRPYIPRTWPRWPCVGGEGQLDRMFNLLPLIFQGPIFKNKIFVDIVSNWKTCLKIFFH